MVRFCKMEMCIHNTPDSLEYQFYACPKFVCYSKEGYMCCSIRRITGFAVSKSALIYLYSLDIHTHVYDVLSDWSHVTTQQYIDRSHSGTIYSMLKQQSCHGMGSSWSNDHVLSKDCWDWSPARRKPFGVLCTFLRCRKRLLTYTTFIYTVGYCAKVCIDNSTET